MELLICKKNPIDYNKLLQTIHQYVDVTNRTQKKINLQANLHDVICPLRINHN
jgi:hypothetical protein